MAQMSEAKRRANRKWNDAHMKERYDSVHLALPKGYKEKVQALAKSQGKSLSAFLYGLLEDELRREEEQEG